ncbi:MAG: J domain-containing protein [Pyrinomonadaceae bacterium]
MSRPELEDHYTTLGANETDSRAELERRYKRLARRHHPDRSDGDEERMKSINEAYRVLGDDNLRSAYDAARDGRANHDAPFPFVPDSSPASQADALGGRVAAALLSLLAGLTLLFLVRFHYVVFLWPLALVGAALVGFAVWMAHAAIGYAREGTRPAHPLRRLVWAQEAAFWSLVCGGGYGVYLLLTAV